MVNKWKGDTLPKTARLGKQGHHKKKHRIQLVLIQLHLTFIQWRIPIIRWKTRKKQNINREVSPTQGVTHALKPRNCWLSKSRGTDGRTYTMPKWTNTHHQFYNTRPELTLSNQRLDICSSTDSNCYAQMCQMWGRWNFSHIPLVFKCSFIATPSRLTHVVMATSQWHFVDDTSILTQSPILVVVSIPRWEMSVSHWPLVDGLRCTRMAGCHCCWHQGRCWGRCSRVTGWQGRLNRPAGRRWWHIWWSYVYCTCQAKVGDESDASIRIGFLRPVCRRWLNWR